MGKTNIGAENQEGYGDYFAWAETEERTIFSSNNNKYYKISPNDTIKTIDEDGFEQITIVYHNGFTKYITSDLAAAYGYDGFYDDKTTLESTDDAATVSWGSMWRMPTQSEWEELNSTCTWTWCTRNGIEGYKVSSSNGNYIFLPAAGFYYASDSTYRESNTYGSYWSSSLYKSDGYSRGDYAYYIYLQPNYHNATQKSSRFNGLPVRPVRSK